MKSEIADIFFEECVKLMRSYAGVRDAIEIARRIVEDPKMKDRLGPERFGRLKHLVDQCDSIDEALL